MNLVDKDAADTNPSNETVFLYSIEISKNKDEAVIPLTINNQFPVQFKLDTGAQVNIIPKKYFDLITPKPTSKRLTSYCGARIPVTGVCRLSCSLNLDLIKLVLNIDVATSQVPHLKEKYKEVFREIGKLDGECNIHLKDNATPTLYPARQIPATMQDKLKTELSCLESLGIIEKVVTLTKWVNSMVMVERKDGSIRLCIDPVDLNKSIKRPHYPIPTLDGVTLKLHGAKVFTKLDAQSGYWSILLYDDSPYLMTFSTIYGRYHFKQMPFGIISAQDEFQQ
ncbi:hypothetical protein QYM36_005160 [Artemia franciscana]|uniref:Reverse transcriptase domain-containing protein n=1 Tax=Artemia franciscana TaxID=6661 RepID=A0AA88LFG1_ARTSF|nr:hypothetical protein QYM36_005160 [Artemia franciscana]